MKQFGRLILIFTLSLGMEELTGNESTLKYCPDKNSAVYTADQLTTIAFGKDKENWLLACPVPCKQTSYSAIIRYFHESAIINPDYSTGENFSTFHISFVLGYETLQVEEHVESLVYDVTTFLAAAGGNLGLFLGFSCLSVFYALIKIIRKIRLPKI
jgi:hypothetical protein